MNCAAALEFDLSMSHAYAHSLNSTNLFFPFVVKLLIKCLKDLFINTECLSTCDWLLNE